VICNAEWEKVDELQTGDSDVILAAAAGTAMTRSTARITEPVIKRERQRLDILDYRLSPFKNNSLTEIFFSVISSDRYCDRTGGV